KKKGKNSQKNWENSQNSRFFSGTVWMLEILSLILRDGDPKSGAETPNTQIHILSLILRDGDPSWENGVFGGFWVLKTARPRILSSHLPAPLFPRAFFNSKAKVIYTVRDPKDVLVSLFPLLADFPALQRPGSLPEFMEKFLRGRRLPFGSWFQHVRGWLQLRGRDNFFWISYEELQQDLRGSVERLCSFLGRPLSPAALDAVVANASFVTMSHNPMSNFSLSPTFILDRRRGPFLRKGISGDWRNHLSPEQSRRFDRVYREQMAGLGVSFPWDPPNEGVDPQKSPQEPQNQGETPRTPKIRGKPPKKPPGTPKSGGTPPKKTLRNPKIRGKPLRTPKIRRKPPKIPPRNPKIRGKPPKNPPGPPK
uniref:Sulfotransferase n=1 Tax=Taeniopygia guttata TaxID=59729 RepID=A0A674GZI2_TAEGU